MPTYITTAEAAAKFDISVGRVVQLCAAGAVPGAQKFGESWQVPATWKWTPLKPGPKPKVKRSKKSARR